MRRQLFTVIFALLSLVALAQPRPFFSDNSAEFLKQLNEFLNQTNRDDVRKLYKEFSGKFGSGFDTAQQRVIINTFNVMMNNRLQTMPYFYDYMQCLKVIDNSGKDKDNRFNQWSAIVDAILRDVQNRRFDNFRYYLEFSKEFWEKNALYFADRSTNWFASNKDFKLKYEKGTPSVAWEKLTLAAVYRDDSITIIDTKGEYFPITRQWNGTGGKVTWERFEDKETYATIGDYTIDVTKGFYRVSKAVLHYPLMFPDKDIEGTFEDKLNVKNAAIENSYPRFESFDKRLKINNIGGNVQFESGFRLNGTTVYGFGNKDEKANMSVNDTKRGNRNFRASAELFVLRKGESVVGERVESVIYFGFDSIYHPSVTMRYTIGKGELTLQRMDRGSDKSPFFNSYHKVLVDVEKIKFLMESDSIIIGDKYPGFGVNNNNAMFESEQFYRDLDYRRIQNIATRNPIIVFKLYSDKNGGRRVFDADELVKQIDPGLNALGVQSFLFDLAGQGFITYDIDKKTIKLKEKIFHYALSSQKNSTHDYDILRINSETKGENARLSLRSMEAKIEGVQSIELSSRQKVRLSPAGERVTLKKNRDFDFNGRVYSGFSIYHGKDFHFLYDPFQIKMDSARFMDLYLKTGEDNFGKPIASAINSRLEHVTGILMIDAPNNKSGREDIKMFPSFQSKDNSYVFYDDKMTQGGAYKRDSFFFRVDIFNLNGLDSLTGKDLNFKGTLRSADIFPDFKETLVLQKDSSLGFVHLTPGAGYPTYRGKGNFRGQLTLNNQGFFGVGTVKYLDATIESKDIIFLPKTMIASTKDFAMKENRPRNIPKVVNVNTNINWKPYNDSMYVTSRENDFLLYAEGKHRLNGTLIITDNGVKGIGTFDWDKGTLRSKMFSFGSNSVLSDSMDMSIRALEKSGSGADQLAFDTKNIRGKIDFDQQKGDFKANSNDIQTTMPGVKYKTSMNEFIWDLKRETITFEAGGKDADFLSTDAEQDSLKFSGASASYDLKANFLKVGGVPFIRSCDAFIYPENGGVQVELGGLMSTLKNARIVCDTNTKQHVINRATVNLKGKKYFDATGYYEYNVAGKQQEIKFDNIVGQRVGAGQRSDKRTETRAFGDITEENNFFIDHKTLFKGKISLFSNTKNLLFEGYGKLNLENLPDKQWFSVNSSSDKSDLALRFNYPKNEAGEPLYTGLFISKENAASYPRVMMPLMMRKDRPIVDAKGVFKYDPVADQVILGDSSKILANSPRGTRMVFNNKTSVVTTEGKLNLCPSVEFVRVVAAGRAKTNFLRPDQEQTDSTGIIGTPLSIEAMAGIDMQVPDKLLRIMIADVQTGGFDAQDTDYNKDDFAEKALAEFIMDDKDYRKVVNEMKTKTLEIPDKHNNYNFLFARIPMQWKPDLQSFVSAAKRLHLSSVYGVPFNKDITAMVEFKMPSNEDDRIYVYVKAASDNYYFFGYQGGILSLTSNNPRFEEEFNKIKPKDRIKKVGEKQFEMQWVENSTAEMFARRVASAQK